MTNKKVFNIYKPVSSTPLQVINQLRQKFPELKDQTLAYAGRLDPMAEGVLLILVGDECKKRKEYERLKKVYEVEILWGVSTDTYDVMGMVTKHEVLNSQLQPRSNVLQSFIGKLTQPYPPYSSARVKGKPLYYWSRENKLDEITIPTKEVEIYDITHIEDRSISYETVLNNIVGRITKVEGNFRQTEIIHNWKHLLTPLAPNYFLLSRICVSCSSGTYMRSLAFEIGNQVGIPCLAYSIKRLQVGTYLLNESIALS